MKEIVIGPSNGWLYAKGMFSLREQKKFLREAGVNAVEFCGTQDSRRVKSLLSNEEFAEFCHVSLHLSDYDDSKSLIEQASLVEKIVKRRKPTSCLIHPLGIPQSYWQALLIRDIPVVIENMDKNKTSGYDLEELRGLLQDFQLGFVLDVQHAFEHDSSMSYAWDLFQMARNVLVYFHVSGESEDNNHVLVHRAKNCKTIMDFLGGATAEKCLPLILEGEYASSGELKKEMEFLKKELR